MSFAAHVKKELAGIASKGCCQLAELSALIKLNGTISLSSAGPALTFSTENAAIARRMLTILKVHFPDTQTSILSRKKMNLKKNNTYIVNITSDVLEIKDALSIQLSEDDFSLFDTLLANECCRRAYLRGAFLASGSVNNPETSSYHFEITASDAAHARLIQLLLNDEDLNARVITRKKGHVVYIKESEKIADFMRAVGAIGSVLTFEDVRIIRDIRNSDNRLTNCEIANETKTLTAADRQLADIDFIESKKGLETLDEKMQHIIALRREFPEENLTFLSDISTERGHPLTKSGINHRMRKLKQIAEELRGN